MADFCFAMELYPKCKYEQLRDFLVLPHKRFMNQVVSAIDVDQVVKETFSKVSSLQRYCILIVDEVKIRPTIAFSSDGMLNGMAVNDPTSKATSVLGIMMKCLHGGPSLMVKVIPTLQLSFSTRLW